MNGYEPAEDSYMLAKEIENKAENKSVLDMGTGFGILAETARKSGAKSVLAVDINYAHVEYVKGKGIEAIQSDLFENVEGKFDLIVFNPPYLPEVEIEDEETKRVVCGGKHGHEIIQKFLEQAKKHLNDEGEILFIFSSLTNRDKIDEILDKLRYKHYLLEEENHFYETIYLYSCNL